VSYSTAMTALTGQVAALLAAGPPHPDQQPMTPLQPARALTGRDVLVGELQALSIALTGPTSTGDLPAGMRRVTEVLHDVGAGIAVLDVHGAARLLAVGLEHAARQHLFDPAGAATAGEAVRALRHARVSRWPPRRRRTRGCGC